MTRPGSARRGAPRLLLLMALLVGVLGMHALAGSHQAMAAMAMPTTGEPAVGQPAVGPQQVPIGPDQAGQVRTEQGPTVTAPQPSRARTPGASAQGQAWQAVDGMSGSTCIAILAPLLLLVLASLGWSRSRRPGSASSTWRTPRRAAGPHGRDLLTRLCVLRT